MLQNLYRFVPIKLGKVIQFEAKKKKKMFLQTLNIEWGQIDPKDKRRVNGAKAASGRRQ